MFGFEVLFAKVVGQAVSNVAGTQKDPFAVSLLHWVGSLQEHVTAKWLPVTRAGLACSVRQKNPRTQKFEPCVHVAIGACGLCRQPTCLHHAMVNAVAEIVCFRCMAEASVLMRQKHPDWQARPDVGAGAPASGPGPSPQELEDRAKRKKYLRALGIEDPTTWDEVHAAFRELSLKYHPDRAHGLSQAKRAQREKKFKEISEAYAWFNEKHERAVAA